MRSSSAWIAGILLTIVLVIFAVIGAASLTTSDTGPTTAERDAQAVYCLTDVHRVPLVDAAVALGLVQRAATPDQVVLVPRQVPARPGPPMTLEQWRSGDGDAFDSACAALSAHDLPATSTESSTKTSSALTTALVLLPVIVTALLGMVIEYSRRTVARRWDLADALRAVWQEFAAAAIFYAKERAVESRDRSAAADRLDIQRRSLSFALGRIKHRYGDHSSMEKLRTTLDSGPLGQKIREDWPKGADQQARQERSERQDAIQSEVNAAGDPVEKVLQFLERPYWTAWQERPPRLRSFSAFVGLSK